MSDQVQLTIDGQAVSAPKGTLVIEAAKRAGIEIPAFCYYEGYSLQAACRMCLVEVEKAPKLLQMCIRDSFEMVVFIALVMAGFFYIWKKGVLDWAVDDTAPDELPQR